MNEEEKLKLQYSNMFEAYLHGEEAKNKILTEFSEKMKKPQIVRVSNDNSNQHSRAASPAKASVTNTASKSKSQQPKSSKPTPRKTHPHIKRDDPIKKILTVNQHTFKHSKAMNNMLLKILERYELDKPIIMADKLDIIWDKSKKKDDGAKKVFIEVDPEAEFQRILRESAMTAEEAFREKEEAKIRRNAAIREKLHREDNVNQYAVKQKLEKKKVGRAAMHAKQIKVYQKLLEVLDQRKAPVLGQKSATLQAYIRPMEVEREFLDAFSVIVSSGYFIEQEDFLNLISILNVSHQSDHVVERAKLLEFFQYAAELLNFDVTLVSNFLSAPWEQEATVGRQTELGWTQNANMFNQTADVRRNIDVIMELDNHDEIALDQTFETNESLYSSMKPDMIGIQEEKDEPILS